MLEQASKRPVSQLEKQRIFFFSTLLELILLPSTLVLVLVWNCLRRQLLSSLSLLHISPIDSILIPELFVREPVAACLPLLPLVFPAW